MRIEEREREREDEVELYGKRESNMAGFGKSLNKSKALAISYQ
jgi:hypothetical protein